MKRLRALLMSAFLAFLVLLLSALLSCMVMGEAEAGEGRPYTSNGKDSSPPVGEEPESSGGMERESAAEASEDSSWSEESEAPAVAEALPSKKAGASTATR